MKIFNTQLALASNSRAILFASVSALAEQIGEVIQKNNFYMTKVYKALSTWNVEDPGVEYVFDGLKRNKNAKTSLYALRQELKQFGFVKQTENEDGTYCIKITAFAKAKTLDEVVAEDMTAKAEKEGQVPDTSCAELGQPMTSSNLG